MNDITLVIVSVIITLFSFHCTITTYKFYTVFIIMSSKVAPFLYKL